MRIALVSQEYPPETAHGGIGSQTYLKAHGLSALGHEILVLSHSIDGKKHDSTKDGVRVIRIPGYYSRLNLATEPARWLSYSLEVAAELEENHRATPLDLIDFPEYGCEGYAFLLNRAEWNRIPAIVHLHGPLVMFAHKMAWPALDSEFYRTGTAMEATCLRLADAVLSSSGCSADWCARFYGSDRNVPVIHLGVDTSLFKPSGAPKEEKPTILFAGKIAPNKGVETLVKAACKAAKQIPDLRLRMFGRGPAPLLEELQGIAKSSRFPELLEFPGFINREDLPAQLSRAHIFAAPSVYEGGPGLVYLEAMACGLPVIACEGSGVMEIVTHEENGLLVPPENEDALAGALLSLLLNQEKREAMGQRALKYVQDHADSRKCAKKLEAFYLSVINNVISKERNY